MTPGAVRWSGVVVGAVSAALAGALLGGRWWAPAAFGVAAALIVPTARRAASIHAGAVLALVAGAVAHAAPLPAAVAVVGCVVSLELHAAAARTTVVRPRVVLDAPVSLVVAGTVAWSALVVAVDDVGPGHSVLASLVTIAAIGVALAQARAARR